MAKYTFKPPAGVVPEGIGPGETFDVVTTYRVDKRGEICPVVIGEARMEGYDENSEEKAEEKPKSKQFKDEAADMVTTGKEMGIAEPQQPGGY